MNQPRTRAVAAATLLTLLGAGQAGRGDAADRQPPGPVTPVATPRYAVALEDGAILTAADVTAMERATFAAGTVFQYFGEATDAFGRPWSIVGDSGAWVRREGWYVVAATREQLQEHGGKVSLVGGIPPPRQILPAQLATTTAAEATIAATRTPVPVAPDWWQNVVQLDSAYLPEFGATLGVTAYAVPRAVALEAVWLFGGRERLGVWPSDPGYARLHVAPVLGLVYRYNGDVWELGRNPVSMRPVVGLLGNPELITDPNAPVNQTGSTLRCWTLMGGLDPRGIAVGRIDAAPALATTPAASSSSARPDSDRFLGLQDLTTVVSVISPESMAAPRRIKPPTVQRGVSVTDSSQRQAIWLEQELAAEMTRALRGRKVRLIARARAMADSEGNTTGTVGIEIVAGTVRETVSAPVGARPTFVVLEVTVPQDAERVIIRLLPLDRSIAVQERGGGIFDSVSLTPTTWPVRLQSAPLLLRRVRSVTYSPVQRYTRTEMAVSERSPDELRAAWEELVAGDWSDEERGKILSGILSPRMTRQEVTLAWGAPRNRRPGTGGVESWEYEDRAAAFGDEDGLLAWTRQAVSPRALRVLCPGEQRPPRVAPGPAR